ncbi:Alpha-taxilin [Geodia barretti]|uniref:Alpha-taxilin n=1 Tax=Geodia barretti TaxID=519541 RepID=A0AA35TD13_GEOBA|nr:Alpha-taxilin [Geodia barretti]
MAEKETNQGGEEGDRGELVDSVGRSKSGSASPTAEEKPRFPELAVSGETTAGERGETGVAGGEAAEGEEKARDSEKKRRRKNDGGTSDSSGKKRFNLREEMSEVKTVLEGEGEDGTKCNILHRRYQSLVREYKRLERRLVECQKKQLEVAQHRDIIQNEYARANLARSKLENLCRELQKHSKQVAEESRQRAREEEERRREVSGKFQTTINEITMKMQEHHQRNQSLQHENIELASKLKQLAEQYDSREEQFEKILHQRHLEVQLSEAKLAQHNVVAAEEKELSLQERHQLLRESLEQQRRCEQLTRQEAELRGQLALYSEKFEEFQGTLTKSNEVFNTFKKEMDKMSKTISVLEKEMAMWKTKYEKCNKALIDTAEEVLYYYDIITFT